MGHVKFIMCTHLDYLDLPIEDSAHVILVQLEAGWIAPEASKISSIAGLSVLQKQASQFSTGLQVSK